MLSLYEHLINALSPYLQLLFIGSVLLFAILISQLFLAKYFSKFIGYWRNIPYLSRWVYTIAHSRFVKYPFSIAIVLSVMRLYPKDYWFIFRKAMYFWHLKTLFSKLDDIVDNALPERILALGDASLGVDLNPFLKKLLDQSDLAVLDQLIDQNLITKNDLYAFCNLFANKLALQAKLTLQYNSNQSAKRREKIAKNNIQISGAYLALVIHFIKKDPRVTEFIEQHKELTYAGLRRIYPKCTQGGELIQVMHDITDFRYDFLQQPKIGKICPNIFLAKLEQNFYYDKVNPLLLSLPSRPVNIFELPDVVRSKLYILVRDFKIKSFRINIISGLLNTCLWEWVKRAGFSNDKLKYQKKASYRI